MSIERDKLEMSVLDWAEDRGLLKPDNAIKQTLKTVSETGELADAILKNNRHETIDAIGDVEVCLTILKEQLGLNQIDPLRSAYNEIKDRTGKTVGGTFIKD